ncbi:MAG: DMT family transporter [Actinomycetes bacterium]|jgi:drug/metabolite transporter (DMT)-like permease
MATSRNADESTHSGPAPVRAGRVVLLAFVAMTAFAANSVLARLALGDGESGPASFTLLRILSGAVLLALLVTWSPAVRHPSRWITMGNWTSSLMLVAYAAAFSFAYVSLGAALGALVLFAVVQIVIFGASWRSGERASAATWSGLALASLGLVVLAAPGVSAPDLGGVLLMCLAGAAWAGYTLRGRGVSRPLDATASNFVRGVPLSLVVLLPVAAFHTDSMHLTWAGAGYAVVSGSVASGLGYAIWYAVVPLLTRAQSGIIQLSPAPLAAVGGLLIIGEPITVRVLAASLLILGGVALGVVPRRSAASALPTSEK